MTPQRYAQLKAKIAEVCPEILSPIAVKREDTWEFFKGYQSITIAHVLRTLEVDYAIGSIGNFMKATNLSNREMRVFECYPVCFRLTHDLDGKSDEVKEWLAGVILKEK